jgi:hypothetical protein
MIFYQTYGAIIVTLNRTDLFVSFEIQIIASLIVLYPYSNIELENNNCSEN